MPIAQLAIIFLIFTVLSWLFNFLFLRWTRTLGTKNLAPPEELRWSASYKPAIGGISFYMLFLISYVAYLFLNNPDFSAAEELDHLGILLVVTIGFFTGLADDAFNTVPWLKLSAQIACGFLFLLFDIRIEFFEQAMLDSALTIFWTVAVMNSINMLDNMDGITASVCVFILGSAALSVAGVTQENLFFTFICGGTVAALLGFLTLNWNPSKIFMGDTGSQMLGALLAAIGIIFFWNNDYISPDHSWYSKLVIVLTAFVVPIADSLTVTINRLRRGQSPFVGGKDHTTHHLSYAGLSDRQVAYVITGLSAVSFLFIAILRFIDVESRGAYFTFLLVYALGTIGFLYSSTHWKKSRSIFKAKQMQSAQQA